MHVKLLSLFFELNFISHNISSFVCFAGWICLFLQVRALLQFIIIVLFILLLYEIRFCIFMVKWNANVI